MLLFFSIALICIVIWFILVYTKIGDKLYHIIKNIGNKMNEEVDENDIKESEEIGEIIEVELNTKTDKEVSIGEE